MSDCYNRGTTAFRRRHANRNTTRWTPRQPKPISSNPDQCDSKQYNNDRRNRNIPATQCMRWNPSHVSQIHPRERDAWAIAFHSGTPLQPENEGQPNAFRHAN